MEEEGIGPEESEAGEAEEERKQKEAGKEDDVEREEAKGEAFAAEDGTPGGSTQRPPRFIGGTLLVE